MTGPINDGTPSQGAREILDYWFTEYALGDLAKSRNIAGLLVVLRLIEKSGSGLVTVLNSRLQVA